MKQTVDNLNNKLRRRKLGWKSQRKENGNENDEEKEESKTFFFFCFLQRKIKRKDGIHERKVEFLEWQLKSIEIKHTNTSLIHSLGNK